MKTAIIVRQKRSVEKLRRLSKTTVEAFKSQLGYVVIGEWKAGDVAGYNTVTPQETDRLRKMDAVL